MKYIRCIAILLVVLASPVQAEISDDVSAKLYLQEQLGWTDETPRDYAHAAQVLRLLSPIADMGLDTYAIGENVFNAAQFWPMHLFFLQNKGGAICGGHAVYLVSALRALGFTAGQYVFGIPGPYTHTVALVYIDGGLFILDPTFNMVFTYQGKRPATLSDMLSFPQSIGTDARFDETRLFLLSANSNRTWLPCVSKEFEVDGVMGCTGIDLSPKVYFERVWPGIEGRSVYDKYLTILKSGFFGNPFNADPAFTEFEALMITHGIPRH